MIDNALFDRYEGLIFDMDGTLIDTMLVHARAWGMVGEQFGYDFDSQIMYQLGGATVRTIALAIMEKAGMPQRHLDEVIEAKRALSYQLIPTESKLLPTFEVVRHYYRKKPISLGSGSHRHLIDMLMNKLAIAPYFNAIVSADDVKEHKPHPETFLRCAELTGVNPINCIVFEDADLGIQAGLSAGMDVFDVRSHQIIKA
ncbi:beta-phosphoglucomutase family hydrolase [Rodentibacter caecimuris]|uniref:beta-phosphoglucomutase family hydrolase n=1 Tax=Rodentibacter caecimuris TaxID=1796644 RepID=UPI0013A09D1D|nr:beta-phosphoglucomutase family hydrolase [Rodentibacter heylii]MCX2961727.1 beta-phosphoglucomutase family hydrolase [Rodentibacter heylii]QIA77298.1 beta-phosphoglucomutase family hydrolase [Rodentibacter heylii]